MQQSQDPAHPFTSEFDMNSLTDICNDIIKLSNIILFSFEIRVLLTRYYIMVPYNR
jgi:hypothetical protein